MHKELVEVTNPFFLVVEKSFAWVERGMVIEVDDFGDHWEFTSYGKTFYLPSHFMQLVEDRTVNTLKYTQVLPASALLAELNYFRDSSVLFALEEENNLVEFHTMYYFNNTLALQFNDFSPEYFENPTGAPEKEELIHLLKVESNINSMVFFKYDRYFPVDKISLNSAENVVILYSSELSKFEEMELRKCQ